MKTVLINYAADSAPTDVISSRDAAELDFKAINAAAIASGKGEIRYIEVQHNGEIIAMILM